MKDKSYKRHIAKTVTWRIVGTLDTVLISWMISGNPFTGLKIGFSEVLTKMVLYFLHERLWFKISIPESQKRHLIKTVTWRMVGTLDTILISWIISGNAMIGLKIGMIEVITKMVLYYFHERVWYKLNFGLGMRSKNAQHEH
jgi:uncharacterized membrane protein